MRTGVDLQKVLRRALNSGGEYADIFGERSSSLLIVCEDDRIEKVLAGIDRGASVRLVRQGRTAFGCTNEDTTSALVDLAGAVSAAAADADRARTDVFTDLRKRTPAAQFIVTTPPQNVDISQKVELILRANRTARRFDPRIRQVTVTYREFVKEISVACSDGALWEDARTYLTAFVHVVAADGTVVQTGYEPVGGLLGMELFDRDPLEGAAERAAKRAVMMLGAQKAPAGRMPVVLAADAGGTMIHEAIGHGLEADLAQNGLSVYSGKIGEQIASPLITVIDDATLPGRRGSYRFDDEGVEAGRTVLVEQGVLKTFLYDRITAMKEKVLSTGNGRRESYRHRPIPRMSNTYIAPGSSDPADILRSTHSGLFVRKMGGGQVNTVNGDFVFEVNEGYLIEQGKIGEPVRGATLTGNGPAVLMAIDRVGTDLGFSIGTCGKDGQGAPVSDAQPTLRIPEITIGGEAK